jgi:hypothetical protein
MRTRRPLLAGILTVLALVTSAAFAGPAQAYPDNALRVRWALVDTSNCHKIDGGLTVIAQPAGCRLNDSADNTFFKKDAGGRALKIELYLGNTMVGKVEWHPFGEKLWVYDTRNDDDTLYYEPIICVPGRECSFGVGYSGANTDNPVDFELPEGSAVGILVWDDTNPLRRLVASASGGRA